MRHYVEGVDGMERDQVGEALLAPYDSRQPHQLYITWTTILYRSRG